MPIPAVTPVKKVKNAEIPSAPTKKDAVDEHEPRAAISVSAAERLAKAYISVTAML